MNSMSDDTFRHELEHAVARAMALRLLGATWIQINRTRLQVFFQRDDDPHSGAALAVLNGPSCHPDHQGFVNLISAITPGFNRATGVCQLDYLKTGHATRLLCPENAECEHDLSLCILYPTGYHWEAATIARAVTEAIERVPDEHVRRLALVMSHLARRDRKAKLADLLGTPLRAAIDEQVRFLDGKLNLPGR